MEYLVYRVVRSQRGIGLVELMTTVAIIAILALFAVPSVLSALPGYQLRSLAYTVLGTTQKARSLAVSNNSDSCVYFGEHSGLEYFSIYTFTSGGCSSLDLSSVSAKSIKDGERPDVHDEVLMSDNPGKEIVSLDFFWFYGDTVKTFKDANSRKDFVFSSQGLGAVGNIYLTVEDEDLSEPPRYVLESSLGGSVSLEKI